MAGQGKDQERTERATPKKRENARKKGQVAKSREASSVAVLLTGLVFLWFGSAGIGQRIMDLTRWSIMQSWRLDIDCGSVQVLTADMMYRVCVILFPLFISALFVGLLVNYMQVGFIFSAEAVQPKLSKIDPIQGFARLFSLKSFVELVKSILKILIVGFTVYLIFKGEMGRFILLTDQSVSGILLYISGVLFRIVLGVCLVLIVLAVFDYIYQRWEFEKELKMTKQEIKDESKQSEGDPLIRARVKQLQRETAKKRMMANVPKAGVVITNPTHLAVALLYDQEHMSAPRVVAKGAGFIAGNIKDIARRNSVPIVENKPLAQVLYKKVGIDEMIPADLYRAVAEVMAFVYAIKMRR
jgi:flagellar biosynthetic protein FlhB